MAGWDVALCFEVKNSFCNPDFLKIKEKGIVQIVIDDWETPMSKIGCDEALIQRE